MRTRSWIAPGALCAAALWTGCASSPGEAHYPEPTSIGPSFTPAVAVASAPGGHRIVGARLAPVEAMASTQFVTKGGVRP